MTPTERARLVAALNLLRPDWPAKSLDTFIAEHFTGRPLRDTAVALVWIATDGSATPGRVLQPGPWWSAAITRDIPTTTNDCEHHPLAAIRTDAHTGQQTCAGCHTDQLATNKPLPLRRRGEPPAPETREQILTAIHTPTTPVPRDRQRPPRVTAMATARAELEQLRAASETATASDATPTRSTSGAADA